MIQQRKVCLASLLLVVAVALVSFADLRGKNASRTHPTSSWVRSVDVPDVSEPTVSPSLPDRQFPHRNGVEVHLITFAHKLPPSPADLLGACRFLYSARVAGGFTRVLVVGLGLHRRDKMNAARFRNVLMGLFSHSKQTSFEDDYSDAPRREQLLGAPRAVRLDDGDLAIYSDMFDVVFLRSAQDHARRFTAFAQQRRSDGSSNHTTTDQQDDLWRRRRRRLPWRCNDRMRAAGKAECLPVVFQGDRTNFCPEDTQAYARHYDLSPSQLSPYSDTAAGISFYPFPNSGWFMGSVASLKNVVPLVFPDKTSGIDQGHACAEIARQGLLLSGDVWIDVFANMTLNMNPPFGSSSRPVEGQGDAGGIAAVKSLLLKASTAPEAASGYLSVHFSGPSKTTVFPEVKKLLRDYLAQRRAVLEGDWTHGMMLLAVGRDGNRTRIPVSSICSTADPFA